jgi:hypothetical protein
MASPTVRQIYALAAALCERAGEAFPETREDASEAIERLRIENGHSARRLDNSPPRRSKRSRRDFARRVAETLVEEMS